MQHLPVDRHADLTGVGCRAYRLAVAMIASYPIAFPFRHFRMESPGYWENGSSAAQDLVHLPRGLTLQAAMRSSRLPAVKTLAQFDFTFQPSIKREQIESLHELGFHNRAENVILLGPPGVGKTHLAINLGNRGPRSSIGYCTIAISSTFGATATGWRAHQHWLRSASEERREGVHRDRRPRSFPVRLGQEPCGHQQENVRSAQDVSPRSGCLHASDSTRTR